MLINLPKVLVNDAILNELESNLFLRSVHKNQHKTIDRELINKEKHGDKILKSICTKSYLNQLKSFATVLKQKSKNIES